MPFHYLASLIVAVETPENKPRFAAMHMVPKISSKEIQVVVRSRLVEEVVVKTDGWPGYKLLRCLALPP